MHPRICLHQVAMVTEPTVTFIEHCRSIGVEHMTLVTPLLMQPRDLEAAERAIAKGGPRATIVNHPFATYPNLEEDHGGAREKMMQAIDIAATLGAKAIYMQTGGRGGMSWEQAAERFVELLAPCKAAARERGIDLMIENASPFNIDLHIAHTLADTILLAEIAEIEVCVDLQPCWGEANLSGLFRDAMPITKLVQVSDYVLGDRVAPCRAVPGDGAVPLERLIADLLDAGYEGIFDLELVGPRIRDEGGAQASVRAVNWLAELLTRLGA